MLNIKELLIIKRLKLLPFVGATTLLVIVTYLLGFGMIETDIQMVKPLVVLAISGHFILFRARAVDISPSGKWRIAYAYGVCGLALFAILFFVRIRATTSIEEWNSAMLGYYAVFNILVLPLFLANLRRSSESTQ